MGYAIFLSNIRLYEGNKRTQNQRDTPQRACTGTIIECTEGVHFLVCSLGVHLFWVGSHNLGFKTLNNRATHK